MSPGELDPGVIADRASWVRTMLAGIRDLPLTSFDDFRQDRRNIAAAESYLRRAIEALVDLGRHVLAKRFAIAVSEYKAIPGALATAGVIPDERVVLFEKVCGYRNRMVHFYYAIPDRELFEICHRNIRDIEDLLDAILDWITADQPDENTGDGTYRPGE